MIQSVAVAFNFASWFVSFLSQEGRTQGVWSTLGFTNRKGGEGFIRWLTHRASNLYRITDRSNMRNIRNKRKIYTYDLTSHECHHDNALDGH